MTTTERSGVEASIDQLYELPLDQFTQARNELASRLRAEGNGEAAMRAHSLATPPISAWAVNQLYWRDRAAFDALMKAGRQLRAAQEASLAGRAADVRATGKARDAALVAALDRALRLLQEGGHAPSPALRLRVATDLDALAASAGQPPGTTPGRLVDDLEPPGFEVFQGLRPAGSAGRKPAREPRRHTRAGGAKVVSFEAIAGARRAVSEAERAASEKRAEVHRANAALEQARGEVKAAQAEADRAKAAWEEAQKRLEQAERRVPERQKLADGARAAAEEADRAAAQARTALEDVRRKK